MPGKRVPRQSFGRSTDTLNSLLVEHFAKSMQVQEEDTLASGSYWIASLADKIYVNQSTITGSAGVIAAQVRISKNYGTVRRGVPGNHGREEQKDRMNENP
jgi:hypothetical protein